MHAWRKWPVSLSFVRGADPLGLAVVNWKIELKSALRHNSDICSSVTFCSTVSLSGQKHQVSDPRCKCKCWAVWTEQHETAAAGYIRWIWAFISSRLSCSPLRFTCCRWLHAHLLLVFISRSDLLPPFLLSAFIHPPSLPVFSLSPPSPCCPPFCNSHL